MEETAKEQKVVIGVIKVFHLGMDHTELSWINDFGKKKITPPKEGYIKLNELLAKGWHVVRETPLGSTHSPLHDTSIFCVSILLEREKEKHLRKYSEE